MDGRRVPISSKKLSSSKKQSKQTQQQQQLRRKKVNSKKVVASSKQQQQKQQQRRHVNNIKRTRVLHNKRTVIPVDQHKIAQRRQRVNQIRTNHAPMRIQASHQREDDDNQYSMGDAIAKLNEDTKKISSTLNGGKLSP